MKKANIVILVEDHMAYYRHGWDDDFEVKRPWYDYLSQRGSHFPNAYCSTPICCPSRRTILTGQYGHNHGQKTNQSQAPFEHGTFFEQLDKVGYDNYYYGKWHAGRGLASDHGCKGFTYQDYGNPYNEKEYTQYRQERGLDFPKAYIEDDYCTPGWIDDIEENREYLLNRETMNECVSGIFLGDKEGHEAYFLANTACKQIQELAKNPDQAFCLRIDFWGPHQPYLPTQEFADMYPPENIPVYGNYRDNLDNKPDTYKWEAAKGLGENERLIQPSSLPLDKWKRTLSRCYGHITMVDDAAGRIIRALEEHSLMENTIIIWTCDHGDAIMCHGGHFDKDAYMPEELLRIPLCLYDPKQEVTGINNSLVSNIDIAPTILDAAGIKPNDIDFPMDGRSLLDLSRKATVSWRDSLLCETYGHHYPHLGKVVIKGQWKYVYNENQMDELYDLDKDPYELDNRIGESMWAQKVKEMKEELLLLQKETHDKDLLKEI